LLVLKTSPQSSLCKHAFVDVLDHAGTAQDPSETEGDKGLVTLQQLKEEVVDFLAQSLLFPAPTVAHYLLGFETSAQGIRNSLLQHPGSYLHNFYGSFIIFQWH
jgi:hypothetical protein